jgi:protease IV
MSLDADYIVDRRRMRRKLTFWRVFAVVIAVAAIAGLASVLSGTQRFGEAGSGQIARITISGLIRGDTERVEALETLGKSGVVGVIVHVDSPGGTTAGSEQLYDALRRLAEKKPTIVVVDGMAASGAYIAAMAGDHIIAMDTSLVGSIGVLFQYPNFTDLLKTVGVKVEEVKSSPLKAAPNGFEPTSPEATAALDAIVKDSYAWFRGIVQGRRHIEGDALDRVADGRVFTGRQAVGLKLVDEIGNERTAVDWLVKTKGIDADTAVRDYRLRSRLENLSFLHLGSVAILDTLGLHTLARQIEETGTLDSVDRLNLDGLLALWHPSPNN